jgi:hypothetical protein
MGILKRKYLGFLVFVAAFALTGCSAASKKVQVPDPFHPETVAYQGFKGPGVGKHIVFIASDHEYRGEETCPALARILAKRYGFKCTVLFGLDPKTKTIKPGSSYLPGMEALKTADLMFCFMRFLDLSDKDMKYFDDYLKKGGPVIGLRTSTHSFNITRKNAKYAKYHWRSGDKNYKKGFGRQVLGETWVSHYGRNHVQSSRLTIIPAQLKHPVNIGVKDMHVMAGAYTANPMPNSTILAMVQPLMTMKPDGPIDPKKKPQPVCWVRTYKGENGTKGRVFCSTNGASEDILNEGFRRQLINSVFWCMSMEKHIKADMNVDFIGPYRPTTFSFKVPNAGLGLKPADIVGWDSTIWPKTKAKKE